MRLSDDSELAAPAQAPPCIHGEAPPTTCCAAPLLGSQLTSTCSPGQATMERGPLFFCHLLWLLLAHTHAELPMCKEVRTFTLLSLINYPNRVLFVSAALECQHMQFNITHRHRFQNGFHSEKMKAAQIFIEAGFLHSWKWKQNVQNQPKYETCRERKAHKDDPAVLSESY